MESLSQMVETEAVVYFSEIQVAVRDVVIGDGPDVGLWILFCIGMEKPDQGTIDGKHKHGRRWVMDGDHEVQAGCSSNHGLIEAGIPCAMCLWCWKREGCEFLFPLTYTKRQALDFVVI